MRNGEAGKARPRRRAGWVILLGLCLTVGWSAGASGQAPPVPTPSPGGPLRLSLEQAVRMAVVGNLRLQSARLSLDSASLGVPSAEAAFHPTLSLSLSRTGSESSVRTVPEHTKTALSTSVGPSITNRFLTGTSVTLTQTNTRPDSTPTEGTKSSGLTLSLDFHAPQY